MNLFITPEGMSKEEFLIRHGLTGSPDMAMHYLDDPCDCHLLCCWIANPAESMLKYVPTIQEFHKTMAENDEQDVFWFAVDKTAVEKYIPSGALQ